MDQSVFLEIDACLTAQGVDQAVEKLHQILRATRDYPSLFYARLLAKRRDLGVCPLPTGPAADLPEAVHGAYEDAIREAAREAGGLFLADGNIPSAWAYFRMIGEPELVKQALEAHQPEADADVQPLIDIALYQGVHPCKGFDWVLERSGICSAITTVMSREALLSPDVREHCVRRLVRSLHEELRGRLCHAVAQRGFELSEDWSLPRLMHVHPWLCEGEFYHIDVSHLGAVVHLSLGLPAGDEIALARELCAYGRKLAPAFGHSSEPPFDDYYRDHAIHLAALAGEETDRAIAHFRMKADAARHSDGDTRPAEVLVNLLLRLNRTSEALAAAREHLDVCSDQPLSCPSLMELCQRANDFGSLAEVARARHDLVNYVAARLVQFQSKTGEVRIPLVAAGHNA